MGSGERGPLLIRPLTRDDREGFVDVASRAFMEDPLYVGAEQDPGRRLRLTSLLSRVFFDYASRWGIAEGIGDPVSAVALWLPPGESDLGFARLALCGAWKLPFMLKGAGLRLFLEVDALATKVHASDCPGDAWYLLFLATAPEAAGKGYASALIRHRLAIADAQGKSAYLETQNPANEGYYARFGFGTASVSDVGTSGIRHWSMVRPSATRCAG